MITSILPPNQDRKQATKFLAALKNLCGERVATGATWEFRTIDDGKKARGWEDKSLTRTLRGTLAEHWNTLVDLNNRGAGVFVQINESDGKGIKADNILSYRQVWVDCDHGLPDSFLLPPSIVTESSPGKCHYYWNLDKTHQADSLFTQVQKRLIAQYNSDPSIHNLDRIMRLPGFFHRKREPVMTTLVEANSNVYNLEQLTDGLPELTEAEKRKKRNTHTVGNVHETLAPVVELIETLKNSPTAYTLKPSKGECEQRWLIGQAIVSAMVMGTNVNDSLIKLGVCLSGIAYAYSVRDILAGVHKGMRAKFGSKGYNRHETTKTFLRGISYGLYGLSSCDSDTSYRELTHNVTDAGSDWFPSIANEQTKVLALKGGTGSGKTTAIREKVNASERVLVISHRRSLVAKAVADCDNMISYSDREVLKNINNLSSIPKLTITFDSLPRLAKSLQPYDLVVLDEVDQGLEHLLRSDTLKTNRREAVEVFAAIIRQPNTQLLLASATIGNLDVEAIVGLRKKPGLDEVKALVNSKKPAPKQFVVCDSVEAVVSKLMACVQAGENCYVTSDSKTRIDAIAKQLTKALPNLKLKTITSDNANDDLGDINALVQQYQVVLASPSLATGVDISCLHFDVVFGVFTNYRQITYTDCLQAIARVRYPRKNLVYVHISKETGGRALTEADIAEVNKVHEYEQEFTTLDLSTLQLTPINESVYAWVKETTVKLLHRRHEEKRYRAKKFWQATKEQGHKVTKLEHLDNLTEVKQALTVAANEVKQERSSLIANSEVLTDEEVDNLKQKENTSVTEQAALDKHYISRAIGREATEEDVKAYKFGSLKQTVKLHRLLSGGLAQAEQATAATLDRYAMDRNHAAKEWRLLIPLHDLLWASVADGKLTKASLEASGFAAYLAKYTKDIRNFLGLKVDVSNPTVTANQLLRLLGYTVKANRAKAVQEVTDSINKAQGDAGQRERTYFISQTPEQQELVQRLTSKYTPEAIEDFGGVI